MRKVTKKAIKKRLRRLKRLKRRAIKRKVPMCLECGKKPEVGFALCEDCGPKALAKYNNDWRLS